MALRSGRVGIHPSQVDPITGMLLRDVASDLSDLEDVIISNPSEGQQLVYNAESEKWENESIYIDAVDVDYDNTASGITADDVQDAIDELNNEKLSYTDNAILGAKNLLPNNAITQEINGVTFTVNTDKSVTVSGTASANAVLQIVADDSFFENKFETGKKYILTGCPSGGSASTYFMQTFRTPTVYDYGDGVEFTYGSTGTDKLVQIVVMSGTAISTPITFKPMIRLATDTDDTYVPYAMTNRELTDETDKLNNRLFFNGIRRCKSFINNVQANGSIVATIPIPAGSYSRFNIKLWGHNNNKLVYSLVAIGLNQENNTVTISEIINLVFQDPTMSASISDGKVVITISNLPTYAMFSVDYFCNNEDNENSWSWSFT